MRARVLRQAMTPAEKVLWQRLRNRQLNGLKFRRQHPLGPFIADFCCPAQRVIVELDGGVHDLQRDDDTAREGWFRQRGYRVIRFRNQQVLDDMEQVLAALAEACLPSAKGQREFGGEDDAA